MCRVVSKGYFPKNKKKYLLLCDYVPLPICKNIELHYELPKPPDYPREVTNTGEAIKKKRLDLGMGKAELARRLSVNSNTIWQWENRGKQPIPKQMKKIVNWLGYVHPLVS